jgi:hypothetical protein
MTLSFPISPDIGDQTTTAGRTYEWNGQAWTLVGSGIAGPTGPSYTNVVVTPTALAAGSTVTGYSPGAGDIYRLAVTGTTGVNVWGLGITGIQGDAKLLINVGATAPITLAHTTGPNGNAQFRVPFDTNFEMAAGGGAALIIYDATTNVWRVV